MYCGINPFLGLPDCNINGVLLRVRGIHIEIHLVYPTIQFHFTFGFGYMGERFTIDLALMYVKFDERTISPAADSEVPYFGTYNQDAWLLAASFGF